MMRVLLLISIFIFCSSSSCQKDSPCCVDRVYSFWLQDNSGIGFSFLVSYVYPDTLIPGQYDRLMGCPPNERVPYDSKEKWEDVFAGLPADTLSIFIFSSDTILKYDWQQIRNDYNILARKDISLDDLKSNNWTVTYP